MPRDGPTELAVSGLGSGRGDDPGPDPLANPSQPWRAAAEAASRAAHDIGQRLNLAVTAAFDPPHHFLPAHERAAILGVCEEDAKRLAAAIADAWNLYEEALAARGPRPGDVSGLDEDWSVKGPDHR